MADDNSFQMSQGYDVVAPRRGRAYPILCEEWSHLKVQIGSIKTNFGLYHTAGSLLIGSAASTLISIVTGAYVASSASDSKILIVAWAVTAVCGITGAVCLFFANESRSLSNVQASEVVRQMDLIERRYPSDGVEG